MVWKKTKKMSGRGSSKRNIRRLIKMQQIKNVDSLHCVSSNIEGNRSTISENISYCQTLNEASVVGATTQNTISTENGSSEIAESIGTTISQCVGNLETLNDGSDTVEGSVRRISLGSSCSQNVCVPLKEKLKNWYIRNQPTRKTVEELLIILNEENLSVPLSLKTLIPNKEKTVVKRISPGYYTHLGIRNQLRNVDYLLLEYNEIIIDINIDGIPLFKSSRIQLWPILIKIINIKSISVLPVGIYIGKKKPDDISEYMSDFVLETKDIIDNGIRIDHKILQLKIRAIVCDSPAKAFLCGIFGHTSSHGCTKCVQVAKKIDKVLSYSEKSAILITDDNFKKRIYTNHHKKEFHSRLTPLETIEVKMISQVALDSMHFVDLGVVRKMLLRILHNKLNLKCTKQNIDNISVHLESLHRYIPKEFARYPRSLTDIFHWKATEFRQFLLYSVILVLKANVHKEVYFEFLLLHCACRLLSMPKNLLENIETAQKMIEQFVKAFPSIFGANSISHNVHNLLHLSECVKQFGVLQNFSAYDFENYLQILKSYFKQPTKILQQLFNKVQLEEKTVTSKIQGFKLKNRIVQSYTNEQYTFTTKDPDKYCSIKPDIPLKIKGFDCKRKLVIGNRLKNKKSFFTEPLDSLNVFGICLVDLEPSDLEEQFDVKDITNKFISFPYQHQMLLIPMLHGCF